MEDEGYYAALIRTFEQALKWAIPLPESRRFLIQEPKVQTLGWHRRGCPGAAHVAHRTHGVA
jgi:hypothetical protein